jgi:Alpha-L-rhamnosidase N-terminal domain
MRTARRCRPTVTALVEEGTNTLGAILADGWYRGEVGILRAYDVCEQPGFSWRTGP